MNTPTLFSQTTIVAARSSTQVVLATDSLSRRMTVEGRVVSRESNCKIYRCGNYFLAMSGPVENFARGEARFEAVRLLGRACQPAGSPTRQLDAIEAAFVPDYERVLAEIKRLTPETYASAVISKALYLNVIMVGSEKGNPFIASLDFSHPTDTNSPVIVEVNRTNWTTPLPARQVQWMAGGYTDYLKPFFGDGKIWKTGLVDGVRFLIEQEIAAEPDRVGPPIDILSVTARGAEWIQRKPECGHIELPKT